MSSKAQRRASRRRITLAGGETVPQPPHPRDRRHTNQPEDARKVAFTARQRVYQPPKGEEGNHMLGCAVGRMILTEPQPHRADLWNAVYHARKVQLAFDRAIGAPSRHAQVARILSPVATFEADASSPAPDFRTEEERASQAKSAQAAVDAWLNHCDSRAISAFRQSVINDPDGPMRDWQGILSCLRCIVEGLKGEAVKARVR